jgi:hypothetical protein
VTSFSPRALRSSVDWHDGEVGANFSALTISASNFPIPKLADNTATLTGDQVPSHVSVHPQNKSMDSLRMLAMEADLVYMMQITWFSYRLLSIPGMANPTLKLFEFSVQVLEELMHWRGN